MNNCFKITYCLESKGICGGFHVEIANIGKQNDNRQEWNDRDVVDGCS